MSDANPLSKLEPIGPGICDGCGQQKPELWPADGAPLSGGAICAACLATPTEKSVVGTPIRELSGRPGHPGYSRFCEIARSWGFD